MSTEDTHSGWPEKGLGLHYNGFHSHRLLSLCNLQRRRARKNSVSTSTWESWARSVRGRDHESRSEQQLPDQLSRGGLV